MVAAVGVVSCSKDRDKPKPKPPVDETLTGVNKWMVEELQEWYYWNRAVQNATKPSDKLAYNDFLNDLLIDLPDARDTSENPPTIDGGYDRYTGERRLYSRIERTSASTRAPEGWETTFGFDVVSVSGIDGNDPSRYGLLVLWVLPGSPADRAGLERGTWITTYNGNKLYYELVIAFVSRLYQMQGGTTMTFMDDFNREYTITAQEMEVSPVLHHDVLTSGGGKKVGYLMYNNFEAGEGGKFDNQVRSIFGEFKAAGASDLILDLRYNGGGLVTSSQILSSLAGNVNSTQVFARLLYNKDLETQGLENPQVMNFRDEPTGMKLPRVYVLASEWTASSSELVINSLRGVDVEVVLIGDRTEGKNVGMNPFDTIIDGYEYTLTPITFKSMNAKNFCNYAGGFTPTVYVDEFKDALEGKIISGELLPLGDVNERLTKAALTMIDGGTVTPDRSTRGVGDGAAGMAGHGGQRVVRLPSGDQRRGGMVMPKPEL